MAVGRFIKPAALLSAASPHPTILLGQLSITVCVEGVMGDELTLMGPTARRMVRTSL